MRPPNEHLPSVDQGCVNVNIAKDERHNFSRKSSLGTPINLYDESTESVFDALLKIFDTGVMPL